jgi:hypothetical protein
MLCLAGPSIPLPSVSYAELAVEAIEACAIPGLARDFVLLALYTA